MADPEPSDVNWLRALRGHIPQLDRDDRRDLYERIELGARRDADFVIMMLLSTSLAALGLLEDSTAVVIGAMLVAPLMGPLVAGGLALVQANVNLFKQSLSVTALGVLLGLAVSLAVGLINPGFEPSLEMEARGMPDVIDLLIAFVSGLAGAYALGRPNVMATMAGVAIAAALVPPLAVVGLAFVDGQMLLAGAASILLITNLIAIMLGSALMFRLMGVHAARKGDSLPVWVRHTTMFLLMAVVLLAAPLALNALEKTRRGQVRPLDYPVSAPVRRAIRAYTDTLPGVEVLAMSRDSVEPETGIRVMLSCDGPVAADLDQRLQEIVQEARGENAEVRTFALSAAAVED